MKVFYVTFTKCVIGGLILDKHIVGHVTIGWLRGVDQISACYLIKILH